MVAKLTFVQNENFDFLPEILYIKKYLKQSRNARLYFHLDVKMTRARKPHKLLTLLSAAVYESEISEIKKPK